MANKPPTQIDIAVTLAYAPESRRAAQKQLDRAKRAYQKRLTELSIRAIAAKVVPVDETGSEFRAAKNEAEREIAIRLMCQQDETFVRLEAAYQAKQRDVQFYTDSQANFRLLAELMQVGCVMLEAF